MKQAKAALVLKVGHVSTSPCPHLLTARSVTRPCTTGHVLNVSPVPALERSHIHFRASHYMFPVQSHRDTVCKTASYRYVRSAVSNHQERARRARP